VDAAMGIADWSQEKNLQQLIEEADAAMYLDKKQSGHDR
jgi:PleD family two-component response regulator